MKINLYCIRHGEALHNVLYEQFGSKIFVTDKCIDTKLTDKGNNQSIELGNNWLEKKTIDLVIVSPLTRTLETANNIFKDTNIPIIALDCLKEYPQGLHTCNKRINKKNLQNTFQNINFDLLDSEEDEMWSSFKMETIDELLNRINKMYDFIERKNIKQVALVGHNSFISMLKDQKFNLKDNNDEELRHCFPYKMELNFN
tara:strand:- start:453 stop:1052 length:600 start_codon:yes stop_codon:yes gene_type:complete